ncbi:MAG: branched-chain amino acid aminotransferase [Cocleimonas sp.]|jgi:branched-chain amino acid aminotransferase
MTNFSDGTAYIEDTFVPIADAKISILDWGFLHSDATYDVVHVWNGRFFRLEDHLDRYFASMQRLQLSVPYTRDEICSILNNCVKMSGLKNAYVELICTRGQPQPGSRDPRTCTNQFIAFSIPFVWVTKPDTSLNLFISQRQRIPMESLDPAIKNYHWLDLVMGQFEAYKKSCETVALVDKNGNITEGPGFNIFVVKGNTITTADTGVLRGITRKTTIELAIELGYEMIETDVSPESVRSADEVFATSTAGGIMPISTVDNQAIGSDRVENIGPITQQLQKHYWLLHDDMRYSTQIEY